jgi:hypothetical protein
VDGDSDQDHVIQNIFSNGEFVAKIVEETDMPSSFYRHINYPASYLLGHGNLRQTKKFMLYLASSSLWALFKNLP